MDKVMLIFQIIVWAALVGMVYADISMINAISDNADKFAAKYGPSEITCTLCEGVNRPHCLALNCHTTYLVKGMGVINATEPI